MRSTLNLEHRSMRAHSQSVRMSSYGKDDFEEEMVHCELLVSSSLTTRRESILLEEFA